MARSLRISFAGALYHITTRGNNREKIFLDESDFEKFRALLRKYRSKHKLKLYAYALMPNHVHLLIETTTASISKVMHAINTSYAMYFNSKYDHVGHVWQGRFHSGIVDSENYFLEVMRYMDLNPVRAGVASRPEGYGWTSHRCYARGEGDDIVDEHELYLELGETPRKRQREYREYVEERLEGGVGQRDPALTKSVFIGGEDFEGRMLRLYGKAIWPRYRRLLRHLEELRSAALPE